MNQLSFFEDIDEREMRRLVVKELKNYKALCVRMKDQKEMEQLMEIKTEGKKSPVTKVSSMTYLSRLGISINIRICTNRNFEDYSPEQIRTRHGRKLRSNCDGYLT